MKSGGALLLVIVGVLALWIVVTGRLGALQAAWATLTSGSPATNASGAAAAPASGTGSTSAASSALQGFTAALPTPVFDVAHAAVAQS